MKLRIDSRTALYMVLVFVGASGFLSTLFLPHPAGFYVFIVVSALVGLGVSLNIYDTKKKGGQLVCPTGSDCNAVVNSRYAKFLGISLERWGIGYFLFIASSYLLLVFMPEFFTPNMIFSLVLLSVSAGLFSVYLLFVQAFLLRQWCIWCILTAMLSLTIFVMSLTSIGFVLTFLVHIEVVLEMFKFFGFCLGLGGVTAAIFLFFHFLEDSAIDDKELDVIKGVSELVWLGFGTVIVSQFALYVSQPHVLTQSEEFFAQIIALLVFAISGAALMIIYAPLLVYVPFREVGENDSKRSFMTLRRPTAIFGGIVLVSWYFAFVMNFVAGAPLNLLLSVLVILVLFMSIFMVFWDRSLHHKGIGERS